MVGVGGSSPLAPTKFGREIKHLAETPSAFFLPVPKKYQKAAHDSSGGSLAVPTFLVIRLGQAAAGKSSAAGPWSSNAQTPSNHCRKRHDQHRRLRPRILARRGRPAVLGSAAAGRWRATRHGWHQRGRRRRAGRGAVRPGVDERDPQAVWGMAKSLCPDWLRAGIAIGAALAVLRSRWRRNTCGPCRPPPRTRSPAGRPAPGGAAAGRACPG